MRAFENTLIVLADSCGFRIIELSVTEDLFCSEAKNTNQQYVWVKVSWHLQEREICKNNLPS